MTPSDTYQTITAPSEGLFKDRGSRFMAFAYPVYSEEEAKKIIDQVKKKFHDARHHCYAYKMGTERLIYRINDDGEPSGTAGKPIYGQIQSFNLTNILIVVVRYFGGKLLGTGGLVQAYKGAAENALLHAKITERFVTRIFELHFEYKLLSDINKILQSLNSEIIAQSYDEKCSVRVKIRKNHAASLKERLEIFKEVEVLIVKDFAGN